MEAWLTRLYERYGAWYTAASIAVPVAVALLLVPIAISFPANYLELTVGEWLVASALTDLCVVISVAVAFALLWRRIGPAFAWSRGERTPELASSAGDWAFSAVRHTVVLAVGLIAVSGCLSVFVAVVGPSSHSTVGDYTALLIAWFAIVAVLGLTGYVLIEFCVGPVRASLHRHDLPESSAPGLATALVATPLVILFLTSGGIHFLTLNRDDGTDELLRALAIAAGLTAFGAIPFLLVVFGGVLNPLRRLILGHRAVAAGDLSRIDVVSANELGELTASFNRMAHGLEERAALREEKVELVDELRASRARIVSSSDEARRRVERDLHDGAQQSLVLLNLKLGLVSRRFDDDPILALRMVEEARLDLDQALAELRDLAHGIYPQVLTSDGLAAALAEAADQSSLSVVLDCDGARRYPPELEAAVYFCCLEALQNAVKHAGEGATATVRLSERAGGLEFEIADDGHGFDASDGAAASGGLQNMADRIGALGGELHVDSRPGSGTKIAGLVPLDAGSP